MLQLIYVVFGARGFGRSTTLECVAPHGCGGGNTKYTWWVNLKKEKVRRGRSVGPGGEIGEESRDKYDQKVFYTCMKFLVNKNCIRRGRGREEVFGTIK